MKVTLPIIVMAFETDFGGVVSNTRYMEYLERGRYALVRAAGLNLTTILDEHDAQVVVRQVTAEYLRPAYHEDELELLVWVAEHTGATTEVRYELTRPRDGAMLLRAAHTLAYLNARWKPLRLPAVFREALPVQND